ncbi:hypothetical protein ALO77_200032 [Pseudomonas coronafaciens pv. garcae]|nr:hypothetical protein ALO77_200032 [Pseudomonas coronafaciens pv. garcae]RMS98539.1 hypothetical protein ALP57_200170 [Pseudomonas coronafaciens pv. oryzae]RMW11962.1 hypothetical protein ALO99_200239 [Pseudomonas coronafaciens pv. porri]
MRRFQSLSFQKIANKKFLKNFNWFRLVVRLASGVKVVLTVCQEFLWLYKSVQDVESFLKTFKVIKYFLHLIFLLKPKIYIAIVVGS